MERESCDASFALAGAHLVEDQMGQFRGVGLELKDLLHWVGRTGLSYSEVKIREGTTAERITIQYTLLGTELRSTEGGDLAVSFPTRLTME